MTSDYKSTSMAPGLAAAYRDEQARADSIAQMFGDRAPPPLVGEWLPDYQRRLARPYQQYGRWKDKDLSRCDASTLTPILGQVYEDARRAAHDPRRVAPGTLQVREERDDSGRIIRRFYGDPMATWAPFMQPYRHITSWGAQ